MGGHGRAALVVLGLSAGLGSARADIVYERVPLYVDPVDHGRTAGPRPRLLEVREPRQEVLRQLEERVQGAERGMDRVETAARGSRGAEHARRAAELHRLELLRERVRAQVRQVERASRAEFPVQAQAAQQGLEQLELEISRALPPAATARDGE